MATGSAAGVLRYAGCNMQEGSGLMWPFFLLEDESLVTLLKMLEMTGFELELTLTRRVSVSSLTCSDPTKMTSALSSSSLDLAPLVFFSGCGGDCASSHGKRWMGHFTITFHFKWPLLLVLFPSKGNHRKRSSPLISGVTLCGFS